MAGAPTKTPPKKHRSVSADEAIQDFRLACISRAIDDREIVLRQQSKVFFQISGAGHEALYLGLARHMKPGYDWFFPYYRDGALMLGLGVTAKDLLLQAVGSQDDPASGGRQMPCHWSFPDLNVVTQSSATGSQCIPAVGCAEAARYIVRRDLPGCTAYGDELTYVSSGRVPARRASSGSRSTPRARCTSPSSSSSRTTATRSRSPRTISIRPRSRSWSGDSEVSRSTRWTDGTTSRCARRARRRSSACVPERGPV